MSLKFYFELRFELCAHNVDYHNALYWDNVCYYLGREGQII